MEGGGGDQRLILDQQKIVTNNRYQPHGILELAKGLEKNETLKTLIIRGFFINVESAVALGKSLEKNHSLRELDLRVKKIFSLEKHTHKTKT